MELKRRDCARVLTEMVEFMALPFPFPSKLRPRPHVSVFVCKRRFFPPFSKKCVSIRSVFESFSPVHTKTLNNGDTRASLTKSGMRYDSGKSCITSSYSRTYVFVRPLVHVKTAFSKRSVFIDRFHQIRVDGSRIRKEKVAFSTQNGYVWRGP